MKRKMIPLIILVICGCFVAACSQDTPSSQSSRLWEEIPVVEHGVFSSQALQALPWDSGRCEATSFYRMAETEKGFYLIYSGKLFFADKEDLSAWFPVCGKPNCRHGYASAQCNATLGGNSFILKDGYIFYDDLLHRHPGEYSGSGNGLGIFRKTLDGSNTHLVYWIEESLLHGAGSYSSLLSPEHWILSSTDLQSDGTTLCRVYCRTDKKLVVLLSAFSDSGNPLSELTYIPGDQYFRNALLDPTGSLALRLEGDTVTSLDLTGYWDTACYLSGDTLRIFRQNEGYFDVRLEEGTENFVAPNRLENSRVFMPLPNCVLETDLGTLLPSGEFGSAAALYNGTEWASVTVTDEVKELAPGTQLSVLSVTSDRIFLLLSDSLRVYLCQIVLGTDTPLLELCTRLEVY